jgi:hypothetical protein
LTKIAETDHVRFSHASLTLDLPDSSLISFSSYFDRSPKRYSSGDAMADARSGKIDAVALTFGGSIGGLLLALAAGATLFLTLRKKQRSEEIGGDIFDEEGTDVFETMTSVTSADDYLTQENTGQVQTGASMNLSSLSHTGILHLSRVAE